MECEPKMETLPSTGDSEHPLPDGSSCIDVLDEREAGDSQPQKSEDPTVVSHTQASHANHEPQRPTTSAGDTGECSKRSTMCTTTLGPDNSVQETLTQLPETKDENIWLWDVTSTSRDGQGQASGDKHQINPVTALHKDLMSVLGAGPSKPEPFTTDTVPESTEDMARSRCVDEKQPQEDGRESDKQVPGESHDEPPSLEVSENGLSGGSTTLEAPNENTSGPGNEKTNSESMDERFQKAIGVIKKEPQGDGHHDIEIIEKDMPVFPKLKSEPAWDPRMGQPVFPEPSRKKRNDNDNHRLLAKHRRNKQLTGNKRLVVQIQKIDANKVMRNLKRKLGEKHVREVSLQKMQNEATVKAKLPIVSLRVNSQKSVKSATHKDLAAVFHKSPIKLENSDPPNNQENEVNSVPLKQEVPPPVESAPINWDDESFHFADDYVEHSDVEDDDFAGPVDNDDDDYVPGVSTDDKPTSSPVKKRKTVVKLLKPRDLNCSLCDMKFDKRKEYNKHMKTHNLPVVLKCDSCDITFDKRKEYRDHMKSHKVPVVLKCDKCDISFDKKREYNKHMKVHEKEEPDEPVMCDVCSKVLPNKTKLLRHQQYHLRPKPVGRPANNVCMTCEFCGKNFNKMSNYKDHLRIHTKEKPFPCSVCDRPFARKSDLVRHVRTHTGERPYVCDTCDASYTTTRLLRLHKEKAHLGIDHSLEHPPVICESCGGSFKDKYKLEIHKRMEHGVDADRFKCHECDKCYSSHSTLWKHNRRVHLKLRPYSCSQCGLSFIDSHRLKLHEMVHRGEKPHVCDICGRGFRVKHDLICHIRIHTGERPYPCPMCPMKFISKQMMKRHVKVHTGEKPYGCDMCQKAFRTSTQLKAHMITHTREKPYMCEVCSQCFSSKPVLKKHYVRCHFAGNQVTFKSEAKESMKEPLPAEVESPDYPMYFMPVNVTNPTVAQAHYSGPRVDRRGPLQQGEQPRVLQAVSPPPPPLNSLIDRAVVVQQQMSPPTNQRPQMSPTVNQQSQISPTIIQPVSTTGQWQRV